MYASPEPLHTPNDRLLTAREVAVILNVRPKRVYEIGIPAVRLSARTLRWWLGDVMAFAQSRVEGGAP